MNSESLHMSGIRRLGEVINQPVRSRAFALLLPVVLFVLPGCSGQQRAAPVDAELARATLTEVLDHWKSGGDLHELRARTPEIIVQELAWSGGQKLEDFQFVGEPRAEDANWFCDVELTLVPENGGAPEKKTITYVVGTDPVLTVFRSMM